ncbi:MAG: hypothetical protein J6X70_05015, partial [Muribaculaceae bacterium]|nr:hypothetical protein [Muribaculaceae bacterium]
MKKLFTFFAVAAMSLTAMGTDYTGTLVVNVDGDIISSNTTISVVDNGSNSYTLSINNFVLEDIPVGNIVLTTNGIAQDDATMLKVNQGILIEEGNLEGVDFWLGPILGQVPINMVTLFKGGAMYTNIDIYMEMLDQTINVSFTSNAGFVNKFGANEGYQIPNGNFEAWKATSGEPDHWHGFKSCKGAMSSLVGVAGMSLAKDGDEKHSGSYSALLTSGSALGTVANGTMTTGQLNAGSRTAADVSNHSEMDKSSSATDKNGDPYYTNIVGRPDALKTWIKFSQKTANGSHPFATVSAILFDGSYYQDPEDKGYTNVTAKAKNNTIPTGGWTEYNIPFTGYTSVKPDALLITVSTNADPGQGSKGDKVWVDDMELVYNGEVTGITINGIDNFAFNAATHTYNVEAPGEFTEDDVTVTKTGAYSYLLKSVNAIEGGYVITVTVIPNDMSKAEVYTINITTPIPSLYVLGEVNGNNWEYNVGAEMTYNAEVEQYELNVHAGLNEDSKWAYFSLTKGFGNSWEETNALRLGGAAAAYTNFEVTADNQDGIALVAFGDADGAGKSFQIPAGDYKFIVNKDMTLFQVEGDIVVPVEPMYIAGSFTNWATDKREMAYNAEDGSYSITIEGIENGAQFKFIDANDNWYGGESQQSTHIVHPDWCTDIQLTTTGQNFEVNGSGDLTFTVSADKKLTITGWDEQGVTLAEALAGEEGNVLIKSDVKVMISTNSYA